MFSMILLLKRIKLFGGLLYSIDDFIYFIDFMHLKNKRGKHLNGFC